MHDNYKNGFVTIPVERYEQLLKKSFEFDALFSLRKNWSEDLALTISGDAIHKIAVDKANGCKVAEGYTLFDASYIGDREFVVAAKVNICVDASGDEVTRCKRCGCDIPLDGLEYCDKCTLKLAQESGDEVKQCKRCGCDLPRDAANHCEECATELAYERSKQHE